MESNLFLSKNIYHPCNTVIKPDYLVQRCLQVQVSEQVSPLVSDLKHIRQDMNFGMLLILEAKLRENLSDLSSKFFYHIPNLDLKVS